MATEEDTLQKFKQKLEELRADLDQKRRIYDTQKSEVDQLRSVHQQLQISQFEAEKVAVAENNINNLQRSIHQQEEENKTENKK